MSGGVIRNTLFGELWDITQAKVSVLQYSNVANILCSKSHRPFLTLILHTEMLLYFLILMDATSPIHQGSTVCTLFTNVALQRLQLFHILEHTGKGGENTVVDGFLVGDYLRQEEQDVFEYLSTKPMEFHYYEEGTPIVHS